MGVVLEEDLVVEEDLVTVAEGLVEEEGLMGITSGSDSSLIISPEA